MTDPLRYDEDRPEMVRLVPTSAQRILDVGCSTGRFGNSLKSRAPQIELHGIDPAPEASEYLGSYDRITCGLYPDDLPAESQFDCVVFNDVLEHMVDPWDALRKTHDILAERSVVIASLPNVRHVSVLGPLTLHGRWAYRDTGILDRTHLRFFTRSSIAELFDQSGFDVRAIHPIRLRPSRGRLATANRLTTGRLTDFLAERFAVVATSRSHPYGDEASAL
jgi:2-polyprenyl-3-methyl-5-hydroxy-6-metoxy-1,4-benzoquinol methylase